MGNRQAAPIKLDVTLPVQNDVYCFGCNTRIQLEDIEDSFNNVNYHHSVHTRPYDDVQSSAIDVPKLRAHVFSDDGKVLHHVLTVKWSFAQGYEYETIDTKISQ